MVGDACAKGENRVPEIESYPLVSLIILNWNRKPLLKECIESVLKVNYPNLEVIVVDNGSTDGSQEMVKEKYSIVKLIENRRNVGFAEGNNIGIQVAKGDFIFLLNNDAIIHKNCIRELVKVALSDSKIGILGCKIYFKNKNRIIQHVGGVIYPSGVTGQIGYLQLDIGQYNELREVEYVTGAALMIRRKVIERIGLMDPIYFAYYEETDWCYAAQRAGLNVIYVPGAIVYHYEGMTIQKESPIGMYYMNRNRVIFVLKNYPASMLIFWPLYELKYNIWRTLAYIYHKKSIINYWLSLLKAYIWILRFLRVIINKRFSHARFLRVVEG